MPGDLRLRRGRMGGFISPQHQRNNRPRQARRNHISSTAKAAAAPTRASSATNSASPAPSTCSKTTTSSTSWPTSSVGEPNDPMLSSSHGVESRALREAISPPATVVEYSCSRIVSAIVDKRHVVSLKAIHTRSRTKGSEARKTCLGAGCTQGTARNERACAGDLLAYRAPRRSQN